MPQSEEITEMVVPFEEKDRFKGECVANGLRPIWMPDIKKWGINTKHIPSGLARWAPKSPGKPRHFVIACDWTYYPFASKAGAKWDAERKVATFRGTELPLELTGFKPARFSYQERMERELNGENPEVVPQGKPLTLHKHQEAAVDLIADAWKKKAPGFWLADSTGLGKTLAAWKAVLAINKLEKRPLKILVTGPLGAMEAWREAILWAGSGGWENKGNDITLTNYERLKHLFETKKKTKSLKGVAKFGEPDPFDILIIDESHYCFPYETLVETAKGPIPIGRIVEENLDVKILSKNLKTGQLEYRKIKSRFKNPYQKPLTNLIHEHGSLRCTDNHPIWIAEQKGYQSAAEILQGDQMQTFREGLPEKKQGEKDSEVLQPELRVQTQFPEPPHKGKDQESEHEKGGGPLRPLQPALRDYPGIETENLQHQVQRHTQKQATGGPKSLRRAVKEAGGGKGASPAREKMSKILGPHEKEQPHDESTDSGKDAGKHEGKTLPRARGEWATGTTPKAAAQNNRIPHGIRDTRGSKSPQFRTVPSHPLQSGPGHPTPQDCHRNRRELAQNKTLEILRQTENKNTKPSRLVCIEILEPSSNGGPYPNSTNHTEVYNLEVEENHNYFAEGVLVSNCKNPASGRTKLARALEKAARFSIWMSATAGQNPLEISYLSRLLAHLTGDRPTTIEKDFEIWCQNNGIGLKRGQFGKWIWDGNNQDNEALNKILFNKKNLALRRRCEDIAGWPELQRIPRGCDLDDTARRAYVTEWEEFVRAYEEDRLDRLAGKKDSAKGIAQLGRLRQKASLLRVQETCDLAEELLEEGRQTAISVEYLGTLAAIRENLKKRGYKCGEFSGQNTGERENIRKAYQRGELDVIIFTTEVSISLHQEKPGDKPRAQLVHDLRWSAIEQEQVDGRSHRNGTHAPVYWCFARDTIEERVARILLAKLEAMNALRGDDCSFGHIYKELGKLASPKNG